MSACTGAKTRSSFLGKGFRVVAIEANLGFVEMVRHRLSCDVDSGRLTILGVAISDRAGLADFWIDTGDGINSSLIEESLLPWTSRRRIQVKCETFETILKEHGIPYYLKIDIEGADIRLHSSAARLSGQAEVRFLRVSSRQI